jgi:hypothetical protein
MLRLGLRVELIQAMKRTRRILVVCPGYRVDAYCYRMGERNDAGETDKMNGEANKEV